MINPAIAGYTAEAVALLCAAIEAQKDVKYAPFVSLIAKTHVAGRDALPDEVAALAKVATALGVAAPAPPVVVESPPDAGPPPEVSLPPPTMDFKTSLQNAAAYYVRTGDASFMVELVDKRVAEAENVQPDQPGTESSSTPAAVVVVPAPGAASPGVVGG